MAFCDYCGSKDEPVKIENGMEEHPCFGCDCYERGCRDEIARLRGEIERLTKERDSAKQEAEGLEDACDQYVKALELAYYWAFNDCPTEVDGNREKDKAECDRVLGYK